MNAGRKRAFDKEEALTKAIHVFWENGYSGTSLTDLTAALGINKPSLYAAFGNKEQLFTAALDHYMEEARTKFLCLTDPSDAPLKARLKTFLYGIVDGVTDCESPKGCLFVKTTCESGGVGIPEEVTALLRDVEQEMETELTELFEAELQRGQLPEGTQVKNIALYLQLVMSGLSVQAKQGKSNEELKGVADIALQILPG
ncbi:MAG: TetR/AcrR family transcriptional regulator [Motiliproteus sp.]